MKVHDLWSKSGNDPKMYRFSIRFIRVERRGRKMRFPGRRARWEIFFSRRRRISFAKKVFSMCFSFFSQKPPRETVALMQAFGPKIKCPWPWAQKADSGPES